MKSEPRNLRIQNGNDTKIYEYLGSHLATKNGKHGCYFRVYAPNAKEIFVVGDFNNWDKSSNPLKRLKNTNIWETFVEKAKKWQQYEYIIVDKDDKECTKADPFAFYSNNPPHSNNSFSSYIYSFNDFHWNDSKYFDEKENVNHLSSPINIYEVCLLSWKRHSDGSFYSYSELANSLIPYCKKMGYTHIELMPITEFPFDGSWGYQVTGYFSPTSRFGKPKELMQFVNKCHQEGIGVILDWVPGHFNIDKFGLIDFDGTSLYESPKWDRKNQPAWGTRIFDFENPYVVGFLISSALFFLRKYHFDGLRVDAVSSILYLDFGKNADEWLPNSNGNNINYPGAEFLKKLNNSVFEEFPNALMIAEEATSWPMVTRPTSMGGLGFNFKWNIGWINDVWEYTSMDPHFRKFHHDIITHQIDYAMDENFILPVDHDEVSAGRHSLIGKMNGDMKTKIDMCRAFYLYMFMHPGKKLTFMGSEFGQIAEWSFDKPINFLMLKAEKYKKLQKFVSSLNHLYSKTPEMFECDYEKNGFEWLVEDDSKHSVFAFKRFDKNNNYIICICNFSNETYKDYVLGVDETGSYEEIFSTDDENFGGSGIFNEQMFSSIMNKHGKTNAIRINIAANSAIIIRKFQKN